MTIMKRFRALFLAAFLVMSGTVGVHAQQTKTLTQFSTIDALLIGAYDSKMSLEQLRRYGDTGLGTFDALDGEMILADGTVYRVSADGTVQTPGPTETTPFAAVTFFDTEQEKTLPTGIGLRELTAQLDSMLPTLNLMYMVRIEGSFKTVKTRSVPRQTKPYRPLVEIVKNQPTFDFENIEGVMIGLRCPAFMKGINVPGYHFHFLTRDRKGGGHLLDVTIDRAVVKIDRTSIFHMILPEDQDFYRLDMEKGTGNAISEVESGRK